MRYSASSKKYLNEFEESKDILHWLSFFSSFVWDELKFASIEDSSVSKIDEREITNRFVRELAKIIKLDQVPLAIRLFHSPRESVNGSDIEIIVQLSKDENLIFPCQAKRLYVERTKNDNLKSKYKKYNYKTQKDDLIEYAERINGFPLYLFYNYTEYPINVNYHYPDKKLYGCTLGSAINLRLKNVTTPTFESFHPPSVPLTSIVSFKSFYSLNNIWGKTDQHHAKLFTDKEVFGDKLWEEIGTPIYHIDRFSKYIDLNRILTVPSAHDYSGRFSPKFRIVFTAEKINLNCRKNNFSL